MNPHREPWRAIQLEITTKLKLFRQNETQAAGFLGEAQDLLRRATLPANDPLWHKKSAE